VNYENNVKGRSELLTQIALL